MLVKKHYWCDILNRKGCTKLERIWYAHVELNLNYEGDTLDANIGQEYQLQNL